MARRKRRKFNPEFKTEAVRLARIGDRSIEQIAKDLDLTESSLRNWVRQAEVDAGDAPCWQPSTGQPRRRSLPSSGVRSKGCARSAIF